jgi:hypothetical protein
MYFRPRRSLYFLFLAISCGVVAEFVYVIKELSESSRSSFGGAFSGWFSTFSSRFHKFPLSFDWGFAMTSGGWIAFDSLDRL